ncbi:GNAT family N-acetyltransferase [Streptomyces sp. NPDC050095]|uniref:GNAT family N-acetyltransferase n=1 Tax=unclassified Streptomyces TaxID=2593676 RepID=UPI003425B47F
MPSLVTPLIPAGSLADSPQPSLPVAGGLLARPWRLTDAAAVVRVFQDPAIQRWHLKRADSEDEAREWIAQWQRGWQDEVAAHWTVVDAGTDEVLGRVSLQSLILTGGQAEISYWTAPAARGTGIASRSVAAVADWALDEAGFRRLELGHSTVNQASCGVAARAGFEPEGVRRKALLHADGLHDMHLHARVR